MGEAAARPQRAIFLLPQGSEAEATVAGRALPAAQPWQTWCAARRRCRCCACAALSPQPCPGRLQEGGRKAAAHAQPADSSDVQQDSG